MKAPNVSSNSETIKPRVMVGFLRGNVIMFARLETTSVGFSRARLVAETTPSVFTGIDMKAEIDPARVRESSAN